MNYDLEWEQESLVAHAFEYAAIGMALISLEGRLLRVNPALCRLLGYEKTELLKETLWSVTHSDDQDKTFHMMERLQEPGDDEDRHLQLEKRVLHKDGHVVYILLYMSAVRNGQGDVLYCNAQIQDISERKQAEQRLSESEQRYRMLVESSPETIIIRQGERWLYINDTGVKMLGATNKEEILDRSTFDFIHPDYHEYARGDLAQGLLPDTITESKVKRLVRLDGEVLDIEAKIMPTVFEGEPALYLIVRDVTELKKSRELLQQSEKLTAVGQLAAGIAHEIRNPLTSLRGFVQLFQHSDPSERNKEYYNVMLSELDRINSIASELLLLAKPQEHVFESQDMRLLLEDIVTLFSTQALLYDTEIETQFDDDLPPVICVVSQLKQVFLNFLKNAVEAMPSGGKIVVQARRLGTALQILLIDEGCGVPEDVIAKLGQPFFTTKEKGTGLGLMVSKSIIENHHGLLNIYSRVGIGTTIEVILPV
jgi:two-component system, sporulation sensor kinase A